MTQKIHLTWDDVYDRAKEATKPFSQGSKLYPVPRGGVYAAQAMMVVGPLGSRIVDHPDFADVIVDDIVDSGSTRKKYEQYQKPFVALVDKTDGDADLPWVVFPWETEEQQGPEENIRRLLQLIGEDPNREGLLETPKRVLKSYGELYAGYKTDPASVLKVFEEDSCDEMVILKGIEFASMCEHHMLPFIGHAHVAYIPHGRIVGISKLSRLVEVYSRRLQVQERLTEQITKALDTHLKPLGSACVIEAKHFCMVCRGVQKQNAIMITSSLTGKFRELPVRSEFMALIK